MTTKRVTFEHFEDVKDYPVGTIVRAEHWGDVAVKVYDLKWIGTYAPSAAQILDDTDERWEHNIRWEVMGHGCQLISCDGPFTVIYNPEEEK